jgi:hypothetical protein
VPTTEDGMSPTIMRIGNYRFFFNSNEESRMHIHIQTPDGVAKFWLEPMIALADSHNINQRTLRELERLVEENADEFRTAWQKHLGE